MAALDYEIRVGGLVPVDVLDEIEGVTASIQPVGTVLRGNVVDQAALHDLIHRLQGLGLQLVEVRRLSYGPTAESMTTAASPEQTELGRNDQWP